jgi:hypothetical protein
MPYLVTVLAEVADHRWHPGIGDPTFLGWFTVAAYAVALHYTWFAIATTRQSARELEARGLPAHRSERAVARFWLAVFALLFFLGINKQLDLQTWLTEALRDLSQREGWFEHRRMWQARFIKGMLLAGLASVALCAYFLRHVLGRIRDTLVGLTVLGSFVLVRAAYFNHVLRRGGRVHWMLELAGIALLTRAAYLEARRPGS